MGHVNVPEGLKEIIQQNNEKAYPQIIMEQASYPYLFHLSDIRENLIAFLPVTKQMHVLDRKSTRLNSSHSGGSRMPSSA